MSRALANALAEVGEIIPEQSKIIPVGVVPLPGLQLDNYKVKREFIRDSSGVSKRYFQRYLAHNVALDSQAVLTVLKTSADEDSNFVSRFQKRVETLTLLDHPGLAAITRIDTTPSNQPYVAYEYVPGISLEDELTTWHNGTESDALPLVEALELMQKMAEALNMVHQAGLVHNDLRPSNIIIQEDRTPVLVGLEFPIAPDASARSDAGKTLDYASPEQLEGEFVDEQSNIYTLGVILYEMLVGHRPLLDWDDLDEFQNPQWVPLDVARSGLSMETCTLVKDCLARQPAERIKTVDEFLHRLSRATSAEIALETKEGQQAMLRQRFVTAVPVILVGLLLIAFVFLRGPVLSLGNNVTPQPALVTDPTTTMTPDFSPTAPLPSPTIRLEPSAEALNFASGAALTASPTSSPTITRGASPSATFGLPPTPSTTPTPVCT
ncbi:MAG: serine/threonine-protein kinase, partial [Anaerolineae bacterium]